MHGIRRINHALASGAVAALIQSLIVSALGNVGLFVLMGVPLLVPLSNVWLYRRLVWGALWGLLFLLPLMRGLPYWQRGLVYGLAPAAATLLFFLPFKDDQGWLGLELGPAMPVIVIAANVFWGFLAGTWMGQSMSEARGGGRAA